jgi:hypothetical protein
MAENLITKIKTFTSAAGRANRGPLIGWGILLLIFAGASILWAYCYKQYVPMTIIAMLSGMELGFLWKTYLRDTAVYRLNEVFPSREREPIQKMIEDMQIHGMDSLIPVISVTVYGNSQLNADFWNAKALMQDALDDLQKIEKSPELAIATSGEYPDAFRNRESIPAFRDYLDGKIRAALSAMEARRRVLDDLKRHLDEIHRKAESFPVH